MISIGIYNYSRQCNMKQYLYTSKSCISTENKELTLPMEIKYVIS